MELFNIFIKLLLGFIKDYQPVIHNHLKNCNLKASSVLSVKDRPACIVIEHPNWKNYEAP